VLGVGIVGVLAAFSVSLRAASRSERIERAVEVAENQMELAVTGSADGLHPAAAVDGGYHWVRNYSDRPMGLALASVTVTWTEGASIANHADPRDGPACQPVVSHWPGGTRVDSGPVAVERVAAARLMGGRARLLRDFCRGRFVQGVVRRIFLRVFRPRRNEPAL